MRIDSEPSLNASDYEFSHTVRVRFSETDAMGIVHHSRYLPYLEEARVEYLRHIGHPYHEIRGAGVEMAVLEAFVQYRQPLKFDDVVNVNVAMGTITRATFQMTYLLTVDDEIRATGVTAHGALTTEGNATRLPEWFRDFTPPAQAT
jgi:acyl-CoA thioester hydrolase